MNEQEFPATDIKKRSTDYLWLLSCALVAAVGAFLRFFWLDLKPLHHDEGVNGYFLTTLFREGIYKYDPANYHGPTLYYISLAFSKTFGLNTWSVRASVGVFGVLIVVLAFFLKNYIGKTGSLFAGLFLALSPGMVYISRYFIHEIFFIFCSFAVVVSILFFVEKRKAGVFAIIWTTLLLLVCFLPSALNLANVLGGYLANRIGVQTETFVWILRGAFFLVEAALVFVVMRMLLAWNNGQPIYFILASASTVLFFATKETAFITLGTMAIACLCVWMWRKITPTQTFAINKFWFFLMLTAVLPVAAFFKRKDLTEGWKIFAEFFEVAGDDYQKIVFYAIIFLAALAALAWLIYLFIHRKPRETETDLTEPVDLTWSNFRARLGAKSDLILIWAAAFFIFAYVGVLFFSSFFTYPEGVVGAFKAYAIWTKTGSTDHTQNGTWAYLKWGMQLEAPILILSLVGFLIALVKARHRFALFAGLWSFGLFAAYTIIPYKTPWLALSFLLPMCLAAGYAINELTGPANDLRVRIIGGILAVAATAILAFQTYDLNFVRYDSDRMPYVYAHTKREFLDLVKQIEYYAEKSGKGRQAVIEIVSPDYWSMPWYLNDYKSANFHGRLVDTTTAEMIVAKKEDQDAEVLTRYGGRYKYAGAFPLRPGVELMLLVRADIADTDAQDIYTIMGEPVTITPDDSGEDDAQTKTP